MTGDQGLVATIGKTADPKYEADCTRQSEPSASPMPACIAAGDAASDRHVKIHPLAFGRAVDSRNQHSAQRPDYKSSPPQEERNADHAIIADYGDFGGIAILCLIQ